MKQKNQMQKKEKLIGINHSGSLHASCFKLHAAYNRGQAVITAVIFFLIASLIVVLGTSAPVYRALQTVHAAGVSRGSFFAAEAANEDAAYRLSAGLSAPTTISITLDGYSASTTITDTSGGKEILSSAAKENLFRRIKTHVSVGSGASFHYGVQTDVGGIHLKNTATVVGNVFSNGPVTGENSNVVKGDAISAGPSGLIDGVHATSSAYARTIRNSNVDRDAYYQTISGSTVGGTSYPGSPDQATSTLPISDAQIEDWKNEAAVGGSVTCSGSVYNISGSVTLGPKKIPCDLKIDGSDQVTLTGHLWVEGNIEIANTAAVRIDSSLGEKSVAVVADKPSNRSSSSKITLKNSTTFSGSGHPNSYILFVSQNRSAEDGGSTLAIEVQNSAMGKLLVFAGHGEIDLKNSINLKEVTGYKITIQNSAQVIYESGLANLLFTAGPSGGYTPDGWREVE